MPSRSGRSRPVAYFCTAPARNTFRLAAAPGLTRLPGVLESGHPIAFGLEGEIGEGERVRPLGRSGNVQGRGLGRRRSGHAQAGAPEGGENAVRLPLLVVHGPGFEEEVAGAALGGQAGRAQAAHQLTVARHQGGLVAAVPIDGGGAGFGGPQAQRFRGRAAAHDEPGAALFERCLERGQGLVQPPPRRAAGRPWLLLLRRPDEHGNDGGVGGEGAAECVIAGQPQIELEPEQGWAAGHCAPPAQAKTWSERHGMHCAWIAYVTIPA